MSKILITGGHGYIGSHAVYAFFEAGHDVAVVDDLSAGVIINLPDSVRFYEGNVGDQPFMAQVLNEEKPDAVLHFAGSIIVPESFEDPAKYYRNNVLNGLHLLESCVAHDVRRFIFSSTAAVYGIPDSGVAAEHCTTQPINPYGWSKLMFEQVLADMAQAHDLTYAALRYFNVAGADPRGRIGQNTPQATHLVKVACETAAGKRASMEIFGTDYDTKDGTCLRDYIHVSDLADAHVAIFEHIDQTGENAIFNCGNGRGYSVREVIAAVEKEAGRRIKAVNAPRRAGDPAQLIADPSLMRARTGWQAKITDLHDIVGSALAWENKGLNV